VFFGSRQGIYFSALQLITPQSNHLLLTTMAKPLPPSIISSRLFLLSLKLSAHPYHLIFIPITTTTHHPCKQRRQNNHTPVISHDATPAAPRRLTRPCPRSRLHPLPSKNNAIYPCGVLPYLYPRSFRAGSLKRESGRLVGER
jgi:hypothetical protein